MSAEERASLDAWYARATTIAPQWVFVLEAAHHDPLRAQEIEAGVSRLWWERYLADRAARARHARLPSAAPPARARRDRHTEVVSGPLVLDDTTGRSRYILEPNGTLRPA